MARSARAVSTAGDAEALRARLDAMRGEFENACSFTEELLKENEALKARVADLMRRGGRGKDAGAVAGSGTLAERILELEEMNHSFSARCQEIERQHNQLANLYVASYQLHATLTFREVIDTLKEILINLVGAESFALFWVDERQGILKTEACEGVEDLVPSEVRYKGGVLAAAAQRGESYYADPLPPRAKPDPARPIACIPLRIGERVIGVIAIYRLLEQKDRFTPGDFELFTLLACHAATALFASKLFEQSEQKLNNLQGFINMLTASTG
ncbi:MAG: GAF domain-containing protein [Acidobacteria bacterium]|nr:GAF domain-containing protein [Acidobacteriota bacterium]